MDINHQKGIRVNAMMVSVLIPCYNASPFLKDTLESCLLNLLPSDEIILIDDHSQDNSIEMAQNILEESSVQFRVESNTRKGACHARNMAFELSNGDLIQWLDSDDLLGPNKIPLQRDKLSHQSRGLAVSPFIPFVGNTQSGIIAEKREWPGELHMSPADWLSQGHMTIPACWLGHRAVFDAAGPWNPALAVNQDGEYFARALANAEDVTFCDDSHVFYRKGIPGSVSSFTPEKAESLLESVKLIHSTALALEHSPRMAQMVANTIQHAIYTAYPYASEKIEEAKSLLKQLPSPTIDNPNAVSPFSKLINQTFGWKSLTQLRLLRKRMSG